nr:MAG TPA: hypothetical protein [Caudoviricetes sp.]
MRFLRLFGYCLLYLFHLIYLYKKRRISLGSF